MVNPGSFVLGTLLLAFPGATPAQQRSRHTPARPESQSTQQDATSVGALLAAEQGAVSAGDPVKIAATARALIASLLRDLASARLAGGQFSEAIDLQRRSLDAADVPEGRLQLASMLLRSHQPSAAATEARTIVEADPKNATAWTVLGSALRSAGKEKEAADAFEHSLQLRSEVSVAYALGSALLAAHDKPKADQVFQHIITASRHDPVWLVAVGDAYRDSGYFDDAVTYFKAALAKDPRALHAEFFLGLTYLQMNQWGPNSQSFEHLRAATRLNPHEYVSNFYLGALESTDGSDLPASDRHLHAAAAADPSQPEVWLYLGLNANREKRTVEAKQYLEKAISLTGSDVSRNNYQVRRAYFALGRLLIADGKREEGSALLAKYTRAEQAAVAESGSAIASHADPGAGVRTASDLAASDAAAIAKPAPVALAEPTTRLSATQREQLRAGESEVQRLLAATYNDQGTAEARQQRYSDALTHFQEAQRWNGDDPAILRNLAVAAFRTENYPEAVRAFDLYFKTSPPPDERSRLMLAYAQFSLGKFSEAATAFGLARDTTMQDSRAAYSWAFSLARSGQQQQANHIADTLVSRELPADVLNLVCHLYVDTENYEQSAVCYRKLLLADPSFKLAHYQVGEALIRLDRPGEAIPELRKELETSADDPNVQSALAFALLQTSQKDEARQLLAHVTSAAPDQAEAQYQYGKLLAEDGAPGDALPHLQAAERLEPEKDYVRYQLQSVYRRLGRNEDAAREAAAYRDIKERHRDDAAKPHGAGAEKP